MDGFPGAVMASGRSAVFGGLAGLAGWSSKRGNSPTPFDAVDGSRLAGPQGSHPLAAVSIEEMLKPRSDGLDGAIEIMGRGAWQAVRGAAFHATRAAAVARCGPDI